MNCFNDTSVLISLKESKKLFLRGLKKWIGIHEYFQLSAMFFSRSPFVVLLVCLPVALEGKGKGKKERNFKVIKQSFYLWFLFMTSDSFKQNNTKKRGEKLSLSPEKSLRNSFLLLSALPKIKVERIMKCLWLMQISLFWKVNRSLSLLFVWREAKQVVYPCMHTRNPFFVQLYQQSGV